MQNKHFVPEDGGKILSLTAVEQDIIIRYSHNPKPAEIAAQLGITPATVYRRMAKIRNKLGLTSNVQINEFATYVGLSDL